MAYILHYDEIDGSGEYVVITEEDGNDKDIQDENCKPGYGFTHAYEIDGDLGVLPTDRPLFPE